MNDEFFEKVGTALKALPKNKYMGEESISALPQSTDRADSEKLSSVLSFNNLNEIQLTTRLWIVADDLYFEGRATSKTLPPGMFEIDRVNDQVCLRKIKINTDELIQPSDHIMSSLIDEFNLFWKCKNEFTKRGLLHKRGFLIWGPAGGGKTCLLQLLAKDILNKYEGAIIKVDHPKLALTGLKIIRKIEPARKLILILEDLDALIEKHGESDYLSLLDGEDQIENVVTVATTNYPEKLDPRIVNRPSRFDKIIKVDMPNEETRRIFLQHKEPTLNSDELDKWVKASDQFSIAHLREMIIAIKCLGQPFEETIKRLKNMKIKVKSGNEFNSIGFKD